MSNPLQFLWQQITPKIKRLSAAQVERWPAGHLEELLRLKLIAESELTARSVICDACSRDHSAKVIWLDYPDGQRPFITCQDEGRVPVEPDRLKLWDVDYSLLAELTLDQVPGKLTRACFHRIQSAEFTSDDLTTILDAMGNYAPTEQAPEQKRRDAKLLESILPKLTSYQAAMLKYLWDIRISVGWNSLPPEGFRAGLNRTDVATERALERLDTALVDLSLPVKIRLDIDRKERRVTLLRPRK